MSKVTSYLLALFLFSCRNLEKKDSKQNSDPLAGRFQLIDGKLREFANKHSATISTVWSKVQRHDPHGSDSFPVRLIVWSDGPFGKSVIIQPHNDIRRVDTTAWDFSNLAWLQDTQVVAKPTYVNDLVKKVEFRIIEKNIDQLLIKSEKNLKEIKRENLK